MVLRDSIDILRPPEAVWAWVEDPGRAARWNPHVKSVEPAAPGPRGRGWFYRATYALSGKATIWDGVIEEYAPPSRLVLRLTKTGAGPSAAREVYDLAAIPGGTRLVQTVTVSDDGVPVALRALFWLIRRFGRPVGRPLLADLKGLVESDARA